MNSNPPADAVELANVVITEYALRTSFLGFGHATLASIDSDGMELLKATLNDFASAFFEGADSTDWQELEAARNCATHYTEDGFRRDLGEFMDAIAGSNANAVIRAAAQEVLQALTASIQQEWHHNETSGNGLTIYLPEPGCGIVGWYGDELAFGRDTLWYEFLTRFHLPDVVATDGWPSATSALEGEDLTVRVRIENIGGLPADASRVHMYLSTDGDLDVLDDYDVGWRDVPTLDRGNGYTCRWDFSMPDLGSGSYPVWIVAKADCWDDVQERDEDNIFRMPASFTAQEPDALSIGDASTLEGDSGSRMLSFPVTLSRNPISTVTVRIDTADGTATVADDDYYAIENMALTFVPDEALTHWVLVPIYGDTQAEEDETFFVNLSNATGAIISDGQGIGTIQNDDEVSPVPGAPDLLPGSDTGIQDDNLTCLDLKQASYRACAGG